MRKINLGISTPNLFQRPQPGISEVCLTWSWFYGFFLHWFSQDLGKIPLSVPQYLFDSLPGVVQQDPVHQLGRNSTGVSCPSLPCWDCPVQLPALLLLHPTDPPAAERPESSHFSLGELSNSCQTEISRTGASVAVAGRGELLLLICVTSCYPRKTQTQGQALPAATAEQNLNTNGDGRWRNQHNKWL